MEGGSAKVMKKIEKEIMGFNILNVKIESTGLRGGDSGHGGRTVFRLEDHASTSWNLKYEENLSGVTNVEQPQAIEIELLGDSELETFVKALEFAVEELKKIKR
ncbi:hypothetical protein BAQ45_17820 [Bacillus pacificus]|nr:hypothetical protein AT272_03475 [Bacillus cereus]OJE18951.1 hypothetical protein BAQ45_17820 [Bacillus pacificus]